MITIELLKDNYSDIDVEDLIKEISVIGPDERQKPAPPGLEMWFKVETSQNVVAWFPSDKLAYAFRLTLISHIMNS